MLTTRCQKVLAIKADGHESLQSLNGCLGTEEPRKRLKLLRGEKTASPRYLVRPKTIVFGRTYVLRRMFFFIQREITEMRGPTGVKFCTMVSTRPNFIMPVQNFGGAHPQKNFRGQKHAKFGPISDDFEVWRRISPKRMKIFKIG